MATNFYIVYSQVLDCFLKVKKLKTEEVEELFASLDRLISDPKFKIGDFFEFIAKKCIVNYTSLLNR